MRIQLKRTVDFPSSHSLRNIVDTDWLTSGAFDLSHVTLPLVPLNRKRGVVMGEKRDPNRAQKVTREVFDGHHGHWAVNVLYD